MNVLSRDQQIQIIACPTESHHRDSPRYHYTPSRAVGRGCAELHDRMMVGIRMRLVKARVEVVSDWNGPLASGGGFIG